MNHEANEQVDQETTVEIELETIAAAIQIQSGIRAGRSIQPCL
jgi:hypothetical protein